ncbi:MAG TPA: ABC transporter substrate-binding protein [Stellaceae bacterium]|nr:ABC transporter substrate-binding protein [Stellaceae bacterium]
MRTLSFVRSVCAVAMLAAGIGGASAEEIEVGNYGVSANGMPYAVAMEKGYFKEEGADITGVLSSQGGGTSMRNMMTGSLAYGEINPTAVVITIRQGADLKIISDNVLTVSEFIWATKMGSPVKTLQDLKGKKIGYTNPKSTSQALAILVVQAGGLKPDDAEYVKTGGFGEGVVALDLGSVDVVPVPEPLWSKYQGKYHPIAKASEILPALDNVVGVTTGKAAETRGDFLRALLRARRKAVEFIYAHPDDAGAIIAKAYNLEPEVAKAAVRDLTSARSKDGLPYWGPGEFHVEGMNRMIDAQKLVGAISGDVDWSKVIDTRFLPDDLKAKSKIN